MGLRFKKFDCCSRRDFRRGHPFYFLPPEHQVEGIRLALQGSSSAFDEEVSGRTLFILTRPGATASKAPAPEVNTNRVPDEVEH